MGKFLRAFQHPRVWLLTVLGFSSGLPLLLSGSTLKAWLTNAEVDLTTIGLFSFVGIPYTLKFLWAPVLDRLPLPFLGRRRGWILATQLSIIAGIVVLGSLPPDRALGGVALAALALAFASATQDIAMDAYRTDLLPAGERASGTATFVTGYRLAMILASALALILSDFMPWRMVYWLMALFMVPGILATLRAPSPPPITPPASLRDAVVKPLTDYFSRSGAITALVFILLYKCGDAVAGGMMTPFLIKTGFSNSEIGAVSKALGLFSTIVGVMAGGGLVAAWGLRPALLTFGCLQAVTNSLFAWMAVVGKSHTLLVASVASDQLFGGMATAAFGAFLLTLCNKRYSAFQFALLSSVAALGSNVLGGASGWLAETIGWAGFFLLTVALAAPALIALSFLSISRLTPAELGGTSGDA